MQDFAPSTSDLANLSANLQRGGRITVFGEHVRVQGRSDIRSFYEGGGTEAVKCHT